MIKDYPSYLDYPKPRKKLNMGDLIRLRNNHELAESISSFICDINEGVEYSENPNVWLEWLEQTVED